MKKILSILIGFLFLSSISFADEKVNIEKQLIGIVGAVSGSIKTPTRELKTGDKIYLNETIFAGADSGTQILLLDQSTFTIGSDSEVVMDTFIYDPATNDGKIVASVKQGSLKVISGLISKKNPDSLTVEVPEGTLGSRGTEFQTIVSKKQKQTSTLLIGPGKNNTLGLRPGAVLVGNKLGSTLLNNPYSVSTMKKGKAPGQAKKITKRQLKQFKKKMKALKVAKLDGSSKDEKKKIRKQIKQDLKAAGLDKEEIKVLIKGNIKKDKEKKAEKKKAIAKKKKAKAEKKKAKKKKGKAEKKKGKKKKAKAEKKKGKKKKVVKKKETKKKATKKKATKKKATKKKATKKKAVKKKPAKKKKAVKKKPAKKKKKAVKKKPKKKKKVVKKKPRKKVAKKKRVVKKKKAAKKRKAKKKRRKKK